MNDTFQIIMCTIGLILVLTSFAYASFQGIDKNDLKEKS